MIISYHYDIFVLTTQVYEILHKGTAIYIYMRLDSVTCMSPTQRIGCNCLFSIHRHFNTGIKVHVHSI